MIIAGVLSGTSADGIDVSLVEISGTQQQISIKELAFDTISFTPEERQTIFALFQNKGNSQDICRANFELGQAFGRACLEVIAKSEIPREKISLIASHGQTVWHDVDYSTQKVSSTLQLGEPAVIAEMTGITCVADFRVADVASGGQGAPVTSIFDNLILRSPSHWRAIQNLGGIANVTFLPPKGSPLDPIAFDSGPANVLLDWMAEKITKGSQHYDSKGELASSGTISDTLLQEMLQTPYFHTKPPKTTGRELFNVAFGEKWLSKAQSMGLSDQDLLATFTDLTAISIAMAYRDFGPQNQAIGEVILGGGGFKNLFLLARLEHHFKAILGYDLPLKTHEAVGINSDSKEAQVFALLGWMCIKGIPGSLPSCTGGKTGTILGKIVPGSNFAKLLAPL
jgi:anhydro-N-acetylmuramic acid kinase